MANPTIQVGDTVPAFSLESDDAGTISDQGLRGSKYVLYFYPKDMTPGCTAQACDFRDHHGRFQAAGYRVFGVSPDAVARHATFRQKYDLTFPLLADPEHIAAQAFGVYREKKNYGKTYLGIVRSTFVVDESGIVTAIFDNVKAKGHVERLTADLGV